MWIFLNDAFLSAVAHTEKPDHIHVRARVRGDIERVFAGADVLETPEGDYRFRADIERAEFARVLAEWAEAIDYPNFKGSVRERARHDAYMKVWQAMNELQHRSG